MKIKPKKPMYLFMAAGVFILILVVWFLVKDPSHIPESQARTIASTKAQELCSDIAEKEGLDCTTLELSGSDTSTPGVTDTESYYFSYYFSAQSVDNKRQWGFTINQATDGKIENARSQMTSELVE